ncbi:hypothetical protein Pint_07276 [Pistacia integerrima]|uniref:Uncharacterized protein n=1 Tax=Pistacia integerrima TaxID=434235 RepID=A0ACC0XYQ6_9ROSI|nr:hypothetical protein Pint_07276 [Pistacia integerrima]
MPSKTSQFFKLYGYDLLLGSFAAFYVLKVPYTKVEESFNVQVLNTFGIGLHPTIYIAVFPYSAGWKKVWTPSRSFLCHTNCASVSHFVLCTRSLPNILALGVVDGSAFRFLVVRDYNLMGDLSSRFLWPHFFTVNLAYGLCLKGQLYAALNCLIFTTIVFRCDMLLLLGPLGIELLLVICCSFSGICLLIFSHYNAAY